MILSICTVAPYYRGSSQIQKSWQVLSPGCLNEPEMLLGMALLNIPLYHFVHDEIGVNPDFLLDPILVHKPLALNDKRSSGRLAVDISSDSVFTACQNELEGGLPDRAFVGDFICTMQSAITRFKGK